MSTCSLVRAGANKWENGCVGGLLRRRKERGARNAPVLQPDVLGPVCARPMQRERPAVLPALVQRRGGRSLLGL